MPVKRRKSKARPDDLKSWEMYFLSGYDYFDNLVDAGIVTDRRHVPRDIAEEAWHRLGAAYLDQYAEEQARERYPLHKRRKSGQCGVYGDVIVL